MARAAVSSNHHPHYEADRKISHLKSQNHPQIIYLPCGQFRSLTMKQQKCPKNIVYDSIRSVFSLSSILDGYNDDDEVDEDNDDVDDKEEVKQTVDEKKDTENRKVHDLVNKTNRTGMGTKQPLKFGKYAHWTLTIEAIEALMDKKRSDKTKKLLYSPGHHIDALKEYYDEKDDDDQAFIDAVRRWFVPSTMETSNDVLTTQEAASISLDRSRDDLYYHKKYLMYHAIKRFFETQGLEPLEEMPVYHNPDKKDEKLYLAGYWYHVDHPKESSHLPFVIPTIHGDLIEKVKMFRLSITSYLLLVENWHRKVRRVPPLPRINPGLECKICEYNHSIPSATRITDVDNDANDANDDDDDDVRKELLDYQITVTDPHTKQTRTIQWSPLLKHYIGFHGYEAPRDFVTMIQAEAKTISQDHRNIMILTKESFKRLVAPTTKDGYTILLDDEKLSFYRFTPREMKGQQVKLNIMPRMIWHDVYERSPSPYRSPRRQIPSSSSFSSSSSSKSTSSSSSQQEKKRYPLKPTPKPSSDDTIYNNIF
jgi:hypothetical protein